ncbi:MAG: hypothetical protein GOV00_01065 [Candidatus Altiarchaeota archaeon]|nr:hypothetical protein [Candidatus Altiarchaeota archaeon]
MGKIAVIRIRGKVNLKPDIKKTLELLKLSKQQTLVILPDTPEFQGMVQVVTNHTMWGKAADNIIELLEEKGVEFSGEKAIRWAHLQPPRGGYKSIKKQRPHGSLGKQKDIVAWIKKMIHKAE